MKKKSLVFITLIVAMVAMIALVACDRPVNEPYTAYDVSKVDITQKGAFNYDYLISSDIAPSATAKVYLTRYEKIASTDAPIEYEAKDGKYSFNADMSYDNYFIHVVDGEKTAILPMTRPQMAPTLVRHTNDAVLTYNFANGTSWSSFCDPTGKSVYRSDKAAFDASATLVATNVAIWNADTTTDNNPDKNAPYYYVVLSAKNGIVTYVSAPVTTLAKTYTDLKVSFDTVDDNNVLKISGKYVIDGEVGVVIYSADEKLGKVTTIRGTTASGAAGENFVTTIGLDDIYAITGSEGAGIWFDIKLASGTGALYEISSSRADMGDTIRSGKTEYGFKEWNSILKLNYKAYDYAITSVDIEESADSAPVLVVKGTYDTAALTDIKLHGDVQANDKQVDNIVKDNIDSRDGYFEFRMSLDEITTTGKPWCWFHIYTYRNNSSVNSGQDDMPRLGTLKIEDTFTYNGVLYTIKAYNGTGAQLAIQAENIA